MKSLIHNRVTLYYVFSIIFFIYSTRIAKIEFAFSKELLIVFVFSIVGPILYINRHYTEFGKKKLKHSIRIIALLLSSLIVIRLILPEADREIWNTVRPFVLPLLAIEFVFLIVLEGAVFFYIMRISFSELKVDDAIERIEDRTGLPKPVIKVIILEARMWRMLYRKLFRQKSRNGDPGNAQS